jgi:putative hydrolase of the HAD superfamily
MVFVLLDTMKSFSMSLAYLSNCINDKRTVIFDLDDTLYEELSFLNCAYKKIAHELYCDQSNEVYIFLVNEFAVNGRNSLFNKLMSNYPRNEIGIDSILDVFRSTISPQPLNFYTWFYKFISKTDADFKIRILTNGNIQQQKNKISSLNFTALGRKLDVVYANKYEPKPLAGSLRHFKDYHEFVSPVYVGDSLVDRLFCKNSGIEFLDVSSLK